MRTRLDLQNELVRVLGNENVYFQPPTNTKIKYPCIIYKLNKVEAKFADNKRYMAHKKYTITHIYQKYSQNLQDQLLDSFDYINLDNPFCSDGLYHDVYTLYF